MEVLHVKVDTIIKNGKIITAEGEFTGDIAIKDGKIIAIGNLDFEAEEIIDATDKIIFPGVVDIHVHIYDTDDFYEGTKMCAAGGITTVIDLPPTEPQIMDKESFNKKLQECNNKSVVDFGLCAGEIYYPKHITNIEQMVKLGASYFKIFMPGPPPVSDEIMYQAFEEIAKNNSVVAVHAENSQVLDLLTKRFSAERKDPMAHPESRPRFLEIESIFKAIQFAKATGVHLHICHVTTKEGVELIRQAKRDKVNITAETCPHYLFFTLEDYKKKAPLLKITPPLREKEDNLALWAAILDETIDLITTDHCSFSLAEKLKHKENIWDVPAGLPGVQFMLSVLFSEWIKKDLPLSKLAYLLATKPAKTFGLFPKKGAIQVGSDADLVIIDPREKWTVTKDKILGNLGFSQYEGFEIIGKIDTVLLRGKIIYNDEKIIAPRGYGEFIHP